MKPLELQKDLDKENIAPLYLFYGEDAFLIDRTVDQLKTLLVDPRKENRIELTDQLIGYDRSIHDEGEVEIEVGIPLFDENTDRAKCGIKSKIVRVG